VTWFEILKPRPSSVADDVQAPAPEAQSESVATAEQTSANGLAGDKDKKARGSARSPLAGRSPVESARIVAAGAAAGRSAADPLNTTPTAGNLSADPVADVSFVERANSGGDGATQSGAPSPVRLNAALGALAAAAKASADAIYSDGDTDVIPPRPEAPQMLGLLRPSSPGVRLDALTIAVLVNKNGIVESVRAVNAPQTMSESVLLTEALSIVKSWHFTPATRDGVPVRYRHMVPVQELTRPAP
jgi:hypothetical protein